MLLAVFLIQGNIGGLDGQLAALWHGVAGVDGQVDDYLLDLTRIGLDPPQSFHGRRIEVDVFTDDTAQHLVHVIDQLVQVDDLRLDNLLAAEGQKLAGEIGGFFGCGLNFVHRFKKRIVASQIHLSQGSIAGDAGQQVVEVVGDAARQAAHRFHLLGLDELGFELGFFFLGPLAVGYVAGDAFNGDYIAMIVTNNACT